MLIRSRKTGKESEVTEKEWEKMKDLDLAPKFTIVSKGNQKAKPPQELKDEREYNSILEDATKAFKAEKWEAAQKLYKQAHSIKPTKMISDKLNEIEEKLK